MGLLRSLPLADLVVPSKESWSFNGGRVWLLVSHSGSRGSTLPRRSGKGTEPGLALPAREGGAPGGAGTLQLPGEEGDRSQDVWQWMLESERQSKPKPHR